MQIIRSFKWNHFIVKLKNTISIEHVIKNYNFACYDFSESEITDESVKLFGKCHTFGLSTIYSLNFLRIFIGGSIWSIISSGIFPRAIYDTNSSVVIYINFLFIQLYKTHFRISNLSYTSIFLV
jgi:hypothetical protein